MKNEQDLNINTIKLGDISNNRYYELKCIESIKKENRILFETAKQAEELHFVYYMC